MRLFIKDNKAYIITYFISLALTLIYSNLNGFIGLSEIFYFCMFNTFILLIFLAIRYYENRRLYCLLNNGFKDLKEVFLELGSGEISQNISKLLKEMHGIYEGEIQKSDKLHKEHLEFINLWVHQMKTPISAMQLQLLEHEGEDEYDNMLEEINKLKEGLNMAMYFARLDSFEKDFIVEKIFLKKLIRDTVNEEKKIFIKNKIAPRIEIDENTEVYSDAKWLKFIVGQLIINGVKYSSGKGKELIIKAQEDKNEIKLHIMDNGIGISQKDIKRVFEPFFTGENGRKYGEATGMGLYITKEVCKSLGHEVTIDSIVNEETKVTIKFKK